MSDFREHTDATTRLVERAGAMKGSFVFWDLSDGPVNNSDRVAKLGRGDGTHGLAFGRGFNESTLAATILDGVPSRSQPDKGDISSYRLMEPDNWVLRLHSKRGRDSNDNVWSIRDIADHTNEAKGRRNRGTMVLDQCAEQSWGYISDLQWVIQLGALADDLEVQFDDAGFLSMLYQKTGASDAPSGGDVLGDVVGPTLQDILGDIGGGGVAGGSGGGAGGASGNDFGANAFGSDGSGGVQGGTGGGAGGANGQGVTNPPGSTVTKPIGGAATRGAVALNIGKQGAYLTDGVVVGQGHHIWHISEVPGPPVPKKKTPGPGSSGSTVAEESLGGSQPGSTVVQGEEGGAGAGGHGCDPVKLWQATLPGDVNWDFKGVLGHWTLGPEPKKLEKPTGEYLPVISYLGAPAPIPVKRELEKDPSSDQPTLPKTHEKGIRWYVQIPSHLSSSVITTTVNHLISTWGTSTGGERPPKHQYPPTITGSASNKANVNPPPGGAD